MSEFQIIHNMMTSAKTASLGKSKPSTILEGSQAVAGGLSEANTTGKPHHLAGRPRMGSQIVLLSDLNVAEPVKSSGPRRRRPSISHLALACGLGATLRVGRTKVLTTSATSVAID